jgi:lysophospholipase L1-like esterase
MLIAGEFLARLRPARPKAGTSWLIRCLAVAVLAAGAAGCGSGGPLPGAGAASRSARYYLALGDSLARGVQPGPAGPKTMTRTGYPDQLYAVLRLRDPRLRLVKLGCPGESTGTMISGKHCPYRAGSQLAAAVAFLRAHQGRVGLVTIDIGANDPGSCFTLPAPGPVPPCAGGPAPATAANLALILERLRSAAGRGVTIIGMNLYAPELPEWRLGAAGRRAARRSAALTLAYDRMLGRVYTAGGDRMADVAGAFGTAEFSGQAGAPGTAGPVRLPANVAAVCRWTWVCAPRPRGPDKHPNTAGYAVIARAFLAAYRR